MPPGATPRPPAPNVLLIIADDHRADAIGALGHPAVSTPVLDGLIRRGTAFTRARIAGGLMPAVCSPSRACLLTGFHPFRADAHPALVASPPYEVRLPPGAVTLPECFRNAGYETFFTGKWHNDDIALLRSFDTGWNIFQGGMCEHTSVPVRDLDEIRHGRPSRVGPGFSTEIFCDSAGQFIRTRERERPFFACVALTSPHDPRTPPPSFRSRYATGQLPLPANFQPQHPFDNGELGVRDELLQPHPLVPAQMQETLADYYGMISHQDAHLGRVFVALAETGQMDNTIIVYLSDHGLALGSHGLLGKQNLYEHSVRVPLIVAGPGVPSGLRQDGQVYAFDIYATLCDLAGVTVPTGLDSRSLRPLLAPGRLLGRETICSAYMDCQRMITDGRWKLIVYHVSGRQRVQLFNLEADPHECTDRAGEAALAPKIGLLQARLEMWQRECGDRWMPVTSTPSTDLAIQ